MREPIEIKRMLRYYMAAAEDEVYKSLAEDAFVYIAYLESKTESEKVLLEEERHMLRRERMCLREKFLALEALKLNCKYVIEILEEEEQNDGNQES